MPWREQMHYLSIPSGLSQAISMTWCPCSIPGRLPAVRSLMVIANQGDIAGR